MTIDCRLSFYPDDEEKTVPCEASRNRDGENFKVIRLDTREDVTDKLDPRIIEYLAQKLWDAEQQAKQDGGY